MENVISGRKNDLFNSQHFMSLTKVGTNLSDESLSCPSISPSISTTPSPIKSNLSSSDLHENNFELNLESGKYGINESPILNFSKINSNGNNFEGNSPDYSLETKSKYSKYLKKNRIIKNEGTSASKNIKHFVSDEPLNLGKNQETYLNHNGQESSNFPKSQLWKKLKKGYEKYEDRQPTTPPTTQQYFPNMFPKSGTDMQYPISPFTNNLGLMALSMMYANQPFPVPPQFIPNPNQLLALNNRCHFDQTMHKDLTTQPTQDFTISSMVAPTVDELKVSATKRLIPTGNQSTLMNGEERNNEDEFKAKDERNICAPRRKKPKSMLLKRDDLLYESRPLATTTVKQELHQISSAQVHDPDYEKDHPIFSKSSKSPEKRESNGSPQASNESETIIKLNGKTLRDDSYWERRRKNNEAAKKSRDSRRAKEDEIAMKAAFLEQENVKLRAQLAMMKNETAKLHYLLFSHV